MVGFEDADFEEVHDREYCARDHDCDEECDRPPANTCSAFLSSVAFEPGITVGLC